MDHPPELRLLPITSLKGMFRKRYSVPDSCWAVIWKPPASERIEVKKPGEVLSVRFWERLLGLDTRWQFALIPHRIPRKPITHWKFYTRSYDQQWLIVPVELQLSVKDANDAERFFKQVIIPIKSTSFETLVNRIMPPEEQLEKLGERWEADDLNGTPAAQDGFGKDFSEKFRGILEKRCEHLGLTLQVLRIGKPSLCTDFPDLQERRQKIDQAIEDQALTEPDYEIDPDSPSLSLMPRDRLLLKTFLYPNERLLQREIKYISKGYLQGIEQYAQWRLGVESVRHDVDGSWWRQVWPLIRVLLPLGQIGVSLGLFLILDLDLPDLLQEASSILFGLLIWLVQIFTLLGLEDWHWQRVSHRFVPVGSRIGPVVAALKREGERRRERNDRRGAWAHFLAARDLAADSGLLDALKDAESRLTFLYEQDQAIGNPLSPVVAKNTYLSVSCVEHIDAALDPKPKETPRDSPLTLFPPPGAGEVHLIVKLMDEKFKKPWAEAGFLCKVQQVPFSLELYWQPLEKNGEKRRQARLRLTGLQIERELNSDELSCSIPKLQLVPEPRELAMVLDGTLPEVQLKQARHLAIQVLQKLEDRKVPGRASLIVFGDGPHRTNEERICYTYGLRPRPETTRLIEKVQSLAIDDYQHNLEVGLWWARRHLAGSRVDRRIVLAIGNSEPHPPLKELQNRVDRDSGEYFRYLRDHLYDWHSELDWREEVNQLSDAGITLISVFMPTDAAKARDVWQELGRSGTFLEYQGSETTEHLLSWLKKQLENDKQKKYQLDGPLYLPAKSSLDSILPTEKQWSQYSNGPSPFGPS